MMTISTIDAVTCFVFYACGAIDILGMTRSMIILSKMDDFISWLRNVFSTLAKRSVHQKSHKKIQQPLKNDVGKENSLNNSDGHENLDPEASFSEEDLVKGRALLKETDEMHKKVLQALEPSHAFKDPENPTTEELLKIYAISLCYGGYLSHMQENDGCLISQAIVEREGIKLSNKIVKGRYPFDEEGGLI